MLADNEGLEQLVKINKLNKELKNSMCVRVRTAILMIIYGLVLLYCVTLTDKSKNGWSSYIAIQAQGDYIHSNLSFIFATIFILGLAWMTIFIAKELINCFIGSANKKQLFLLTLSMLLIQLVPTFLWLIPNYFSQDPKNLWIWFLTFMASGILIATISYIFYIKLAKNGEKSNKFNVVVFPLAIVGICVALACLYYICIVRYWTTIIILVFVICSSDIMQYFSGLLFGKHKLAPIVSPKKTWEGAIIGSFTSLLITMVIMFFIGIFLNNTFDSKDVFYNFFGAQFFVHFNLWHNKWQWWVACQIVIIILEFFVILGDLLFSTFKRKNKIKDFGNLLPGHGGYLDRMDSLLTVIFIFGIATFSISCFVSLYHAANNEPDFKWFILIFPAWY